MDRLLTSHPGWIWLEKSNGSGRELRDPEPAKIDAHINEIAIVDFFLVELLVYCPVLTEGMGT
jgi:hypothetical protein